MLKLRRYRSLPNTVTNDIIPLVTSIPSLPAYISGLASSIAATHSNVLSVLSLRYSWVPEFKVHHFPASSLAYLHPSAKPPGVYRIIVPLIGLSSVGVSSFVT